jgi:hypothetical protein
LYSLHILKITHCSLARRISNMLGVETSQETSSSLPLFENIQPPDSMDPYDIMREEKEK